MMLFYYDVSTKRYHGKIKISFKIEIIFEISKKSCTIPWMGAFLNRGQT